MLRPRYLVGFTGHRSGLDEARLRPFLHKGLADLQQRATNLGGRLELYASIAEGADTLCVEVARDLDIPVHILLPLGEEDFATDYSSPAAWERSARQIALSRQRPGRDSVHQVPGESTRPDCYFNQGVHMLAAVDVLIAVWDGQPARGTGGTEQILAQARRMNVPTLQVDAATGECTTHGAVAECFAPDAAIAELNTAAKETANFCANDAATPDALFECLDQIAIAEASRFRPTLVLIILLHGFAALLATVITFKAAEQSAWEHWKWLITALELVLVSLALWMGIRLHRRHTQQRWIRCRFAAEIVRGMLCSIPILDPLHPAIARHDPRWRRFALTVGLLVLEHQDTTDPIVLRDRYIAVRLSESHTHGQVLHFRMMRPSAMKWWNCTGFISAWAATLAPLFVLLSLANKLSTHRSGYSGWGLDKSFWTWLVVVFLPIALPLAAGVANSLRHGLDAGRRKERYPEMVARLLEIKNSLGGLVTRSSIHAAVANSEELLLDELLDWELAMKNTGH